jgi:hypothetical protein
MPAYVYAARTIKVNSVALMAHRIPTSVSCNGTSYISLGLCADWCVILNVNVAV